MPELILKFTKRKDGHARLRCVRPDGSDTWQKQADERALFFPLHDLTHFVVETELGFGSGFFGLIASGWDTTGKGSRGPLPDEAIEVEYIVGALGGERAGDFVCAEDEFNRLAAAFAQTKGLPNPRSLTDADLARVRRRIGELCTRWMALPSGASLELSFRS